MPDWPLLFYVRQTLLVHLAKTTPTLIFEAFQQFDTDVMRGLSSCIANCITDSAWHQAQISLSRGGLGLLSHSKLSCVAFIAAFCSSGFAASEKSHLIQAVARFNGLVPPSNATTVTSLVASPPSQRSLSVKLDHFDFQIQYLTNLCWLIKHVCCQCQYLMLLHGFLSSLLLAWVCT